MSFFLRWLFAFVLLAATYNPSPFNYIRWSMENVDTNLPLVVLFGIVLLIGYIIYLRATLRSIGMFGMLLVMALVAAIIWALVYYGLLDLSDPKLSTWIGIFAMSLVLGTGLSWSIIRRKLSGQIDMDDVEE